MPAAISSAPVSAASALQLALEPAPADGGLAIAASGGDALSFTALFKQLAARQLPAAASSLPPVMQAEVPATTDVTETLDTLAALLPFLEAMGLTNQAGAPADATPDAIAATLAEAIADSDTLRSPKGRKSDTADVSTNVLTDIPAAMVPTETIGLVALAIPATPPVSAPAPAATPVAAATAATVSTRPAISAAATLTEDGSTTQDGLLPHASRGIKEVPPTQTPVGMPASGRNPDTADSRGREFSSQLVAAIDGSKEIPRSPGSTAAAVQQVIAMANPHNVQAPGTAMPSLSVTQPAGAANWGEEVGNHIVWLVNRMENRAELVLTPPQMGRIEVSLTLSGDQANASFVSTNPAVREMLESALPRLRDVLADAGIQLGQAQVSAENARQSAQQEKNGDNSGFDRGLKPDTEAFQAVGNATQSSSGLKMGRGLVDVFA